MESALIHFTMKNKMQGFSKHGELIILTVCTCYVVFFKSFLFETVIVVNNKLKLSISIMNNINTNRQ